jgi:hypothetical protein
MIHLSLKLLREVSTLLTLLKPLTAFQLSKAFLTPFFQYFSHLHKPCTLMAPVGEKSIKSQKVNSITVFIFGGIALFLASCMNNNFGDSGYTGNSGTSLTASSGGQGQAGSFLKISQIVRSQRNPAGVLDVIGDGSTPFSQYCTANDDGEGNKCQCVFKYQASNGAQEEFQVPVSYQERNLVRCPYDRVPRNIDSVTVQLYLSNAGLFSNSISLPMGVGNGRLDLTDARSFVKPTRYQCRDRLTIGSLFAPTVYDPFQSESSDLFYPLNFYTSNVGHTLQLLAAIINIPDEYGVTLEDLQTRFLEWECDFNDIRPKHWRNMRIFSSYGDNQGSKVIHSDSIGSERSEFHLARAATGVFNLPLHALIAPGVDSAPDLSQINNNPFPPLGYAASPIPTGTGTERCPTEVEIPDGFKWVKVWTFRGDLFPREYLGATRSVNETTAIYCNPGETWKAQDGITDMNPFNDCGNTGNSLQMGFNEINNASRVLDFRSQSQTAHACFRPVTIGAGTATFPEVDRWAKLRLDMDQQYNPWSLTTNAGGHWTAGSFSVPTDQNLQGFDFLPLEDQSRYDYLFVVSPPEVMSTDMKAITNSAQPYIPYRYRALHHCDTDDPDDGIALCSSAKEISYGLWSTRVLANPDDAPGTDGRDEYRPVCAIQRN